MNALFRKYVDNQCSSRDAHALFSHFNNPGCEAQLRELISDCLETIYINEEESQWMPVTDKIFDSLKSQLKN
jgi:hypothetical protein